MPKTWRTPSAWSASGAYITEPSPIVATTLRPGRASWTPIAAPIPQPSVPVFEPKNDAGVANGMDRSTKGSDVADSSTTTASRGRSDASACMRYARPIGGRRREQPAPPEWMITREVGAAVHGLAVDPRAEELGEGHQGGEGARAGDSVPRDHERRAGSCQELGRARDRGRLGA